MTDQNSATSDQNSATEMHYRPEEVQRELEIKSTPYYDRIKFLGIKAKKDKEGKAYLDSAQFDLMKRLDQHIQETGKMDGFVISEVGEGEGGELAIANQANLAEVENGNLASPAPEEPKTEEVPFERELDSLMRAAAELKVQQLVMPELLVQSLADRMTYEDLPTDMKRMVDSARETARPKHPSQIADQLLQRYRSREQVA